MQINILRLLGFLMIASFILMGDSCNGGPGLGNTQRYSIKFAIDWGTLNPCSLQSNPVNLKDGSFNMEVLSDGSRGGVPEWIKVNPVHFEPSQTSIGIDLPSDRDFVARISWSPPVLSFLLYALCRWVCP